MNVKNKYIGEFFVLHASTGYTWVLPWILNILHIKCCILNILHIKCWILNILEKNASMALATHGCSLTSKAAAWKMPLSLSSLHWENAQSHVYTNIYLERTRLFKKTILSQFFHHNVKSAKFNPYTSNPQCYRRSNQK